MGGVTQIIPNNRIAQRLNLTRTLMMSPSQLNLTPQDIADLISFLRE
jgi:hypothetical protein